MKMGWWITFDDESNQQLKKIIQNLADEYYNGQTFTPHLAVYSYLEMSDSEAETFADEIANTISSFECEVLEIDSQEKVSKTLFLRIKKNEQLEKLCNIFEVRFRDNFEFDPHASLIYKEDLPIEDREQLKKTIVFPKVLKIDSISYYQVDKEYKSAEFFYKWPKPIKTKLKNSKV